MTNEHLISQTLQSCEILWSVYLYPAWSHVLCVTVGTCELNALNFKLHSWLQIMLLFINWPLSY